ncbi:MAG TPA: hypothetical protein VNO30_29450 [Kofleriaceae bacterium]|nr:hypothetical protein [Kofleriaceae bacterium]
MDEGRATSGAIPDFSLHRLVLAAAHDLCPQLERWQLEQRVIAVRT